MENLYVVTINPTAEYVLHWIVFGQVGCAKGSCSEGGICQSKSGVSADRIVSVQIGSAMGSYGEGAFCQISQQNIPWVLLS